MVIAISVGVLLASLLFIRTIAEMTKAIEQPAPEDLNDVLALSYQWSIILCRGR